MSQRIDTTHNADIMTTEEVAQFLHKSPSWVYKNWQKLGAVKLGGSLFFPKKEDLYECLFNIRKGVEVRFHPEQAAVHRGLFQNQNGGQTSRSTKKKGGRARAKSAKGADPNRHGIFGASKPAA